MNMLHAFYFNHASLPVHVSSFHNKIQYMYVIYVKLINLCTCTFKNTHSLETILNLNLRKYFFCCFYEYSYRVKIKLLYFHCSENVTVHACIQ